MRKEHYDVYLKHAFTLEVYEESDKEIIKGILIDKENGERTFKITEGIVRFTEDSSYAENFGVQWNEFKSTQLDSHSGIPLTFNRFWNNTKWRPMELNGSRVLEIGSGAGRFTEVLMDSGAKVVSVDMSSAVDANRKNNGSAKDLFLIQSSIEELPLKRDSFDYVFCYGVLQHTPNPSLALKAAYSFLKPGGKMSIDYYRLWNFPNVWSTPKYIWRPITTKLTPNHLLKIISFYIPFWIRIDTIIRRIPFFGPRLLSVIPIPCWNYINIGLSKKQRVEWAIMDTFDALGAAYDYPITKAGLEKQLEDIGVTDALVFYGSNGIVANFGK